MQDGGAAEVGPPTTVLGALWNDLPLLNYLLYAVAIAYAEVANLTPPRPELFFSCLFPLAVPILLYGLRWKRASQMQRRASLLAVVAAVVLLTLTFLVAAPYPIASERLRLIYELSAIANTLLLALHAWHHCRAWLGLLFGPIATYGLLLENGGILLGYFDELDYYLYLGPLPAPVATMSGWITVFYLVLWVTWEVRRELPRAADSFVASALVATVAALLLDLQIDPLATAVGFWAWSARLDTGPMGVPLLNFVAWGAAVFPFALFLFWRQGHLGLTPAAVATRSHRNWLWLRVPAVLALAAVIFLVTMTLIELGFDGPTWQILQETLWRWGWMAPDAVWVPGG